MFRTDLMAMVLAAGMAVFAPGVQGAETTNGYAAVNGLRMYYEIHGSGRPLVLLHGALMSIDSAFGKLIPALAGQHRVIALELQGHGRTADIDRPFSMEQMADDVAALMREIGTEDADIFGYSLGGAVALQVAIRHPDLVRKLVIASAGYNTGGLRPGIAAGIAELTPEAFAGTPWEAEYERLAPNPADWPVLIEKVKELDGKVQDWLPEHIQAVKAPAFVLLGDSDIIRIEHAVDLFRLLGGDVAGDIVGLPRSRLAVLPATTHIGVMGETELLSALVLRFLDAPMPGEK
ncbi:MAG TPA: alpha/beta hydrolase [Paracoccaceae bacterium]|nr:alpha/beta hydrolase [Paracoccaceae bacterium]